MAGHGHLDPRLRCDIPCHGFDDELVAHCASWEVDVFKDCAWIKGDRCDGATDVDGNIVVQRLIIVRHHIEGDALAPSDIAIGGQFDLEADVGRVLRHVQNHFTKRGRAGACQRAAFVLDEASPQREVHLRHGHAQTGCDLAFDRHHHRLQAGGSGGKHLVAEAQVGIEAHRHARAIRVCRERDSKGVRLGRAEREGRIKVLHDVDIVRHAHAVADELSCQRHHKGLRLRQRAIGTHWLCASGHHVAHASINRSSHVELKICVEVASNARQLRRLPITCGFRV